MTRPPWHRFEPSLAGPLLCLVALALLFIPWTIGWFIVGGRRRGRSG